MAENLALTDGKPRTSMDFDRQKREKAIYFGSLKKMFVKPKNADFAARGQASKKLLGNSVTVARLTLDQLVQVRILVPQLLSAYYPLLIGKLNIRK